MNTKLILLDGIPGSGKSTTADFIHRQLKGNGITARWLHELEDANPLFNAEYINTRTIEDATTYVNNTSDKWNNLVKEIQEQEIVYIIEGYILQATVGCMFDNNIERNLILKYSENVSEIIQSLHPRIIYFSPEDVQKNLMNLRNVRDKEWIESRGESLSKSKYAVAHNLEGFEGWVTMLSTRAKLANEIVQSYQFPKIVIDSTEGSWDKYGTQICEFLGVHRVQEKNLQ